MPADTIHYLSVDVGVLSSDRTLNVPPNQAQRIDQEHLVALIHPDTQACALLQLAPDTIRKLLKIQLNQAHDISLLDQLMMLIPTPQAALDGIYLRNNKGRLIAELGYTNNGSPIEYLPLPQIDTALCTALTLDHLCPEGFPLFVEYSLLNGALYRDINNLYEYTESVTRLTFIPRS